MHSLLNLRCVIYGYSSWHHASIPVKVSNANGRYIEANLTPDFG